MAFGLCNSPATYTRVINLVLMGLNWKVVLAFLDDILVLGKDFEGHLANLRAVLVRFREHGLKLKPKKCELFQKEVEFLSRVVGPRGIYIGPGYIKEIKKTGQGLRKKRRWRGCWVFGPGRLERRKRQALSPRGVCTRGSRRGTGVIRELLR